MTRLTTLPDPEAVAVRAAAEIARLLRDARERRGVKRVLCGLCRLRRRSLFVRESATERGGTS